MSIECNHDLRGQGINRFGRLHSRNRLRWICWSRALGASIYDVHRLYGFFDPLPLSVRKFDTVFRKFVAFLDPPATSERTSYMEAPLRDTAKWHHDHNHDTTITKKRISYHSGQMGYLHLNAVPVVVHRPSPMPAPYLSSRHLFSKARQ